MLNVANLTNTNEERSIEMITLDESSLSNVSINESANYRNLSSSFEWPWPEPPNFLETMPMAQQQPSTSTKSSEIETIEMAQHQLILLNGQNHLTFLFKKIFRLFLL